MKNIDTQDYYSQTEDQRHLVNKWCKSIGISNRSITFHKNFDDVVILFQIRRDNWSYMNAHEKGVWAGYWNWVYHNDHPLSPKALKKFTSIIEQVLTRIQKQNQARNKIKSARADRKMVSSY